jgi:hypothetical protein
MTLIELLIVLALLGGLATLALTSVGELSARGRVDTTRQRLDTIRAAVVGDGVIPGRFISDMGRLPAITTASEGEEFEELLTDAGNLGRAGDYTHTPSVGSESFSDITVTTHYGWNGPYVSLTRAKLYDGFGNRFQVKTNVNTAWHEADAADVSGNAVIRAVRSLGMDGTAGGGTWQTADIEVDDLGNLASSELTIRVLVRNLTDISSPRWTAPVFAAVTTTEPTTARAYAQNEVYLQADDRVFLCTQPGTLANPVASPTWSNYYDLGDEVVLTDGDTVKWTCMGDYHQFFSDVAAVVFEPDSSGATMGVDERSGSLVAGDATITVSNLTPGLRWFIVHGGLVAGTPARKANCYKSGLQAIELRPGANFVTVYLSEELN